jgi:hypothetical protein
LPLFRNELLRTVLNYRSLKVNDYLTHHNNLAYETKELLLEKITSEDNGLNIESKKVLEEIVNNYRPEDPDKPILDIFPY